METHLVVKMEVEEQAGRYLSDGFHCAEAVVKSVLDALGEDGATAAAHATPFGAGVGSTRQELCGALSGSLIGIGHFFGRQTPGMDWDKAARLAQELHQWFSDTHGDICCASLCDRFGESDQKEKCLDLTRNMAGRLYDLLIREGAGQNTTGCGGCARQ